MLHRDTIVESEHTVHVAHKSDIDTWHCHLGHSSFKFVKIVLSSLNVKNNAAKLSFFTACQ